MLTKSKQIFKGFTLIELLVVISLIGVLSTLLLANFNAVRQRSRDTQRKSDMRNIQTALRIYFNDEGGYPASNSSEEILGCDPGGTGTCSWEGQWSVGTTIYMSVLPGDPIPGQDYRYIQTDLDTYTLDSCLENKSDDKCNGNDSWCTANMGCIYSVQP